MTTTASGSNSTISSTLRPLFDRHVHIHKDELGIPTFVEFNALLSIARLVNFLEARLFQNELQLSTKVRLIINDESSGSTAHAFFSRPTLTVEQKSKHRN